MITKELFSHAWVYTNTQDAMTETGVTASIILCFGTTPESRVALWHTKDTDGKWRFMTPTFPITSAQGIKQIPCLFGQFCDELTGMAETVQGNLKAALKLSGKTVDYGKIYKVVGTQVEIQEPCKK